MGEEDSKAVVSSMKLISGDFFPLPIMLDIDRENAKALRLGRWYSLLFEGKQAGEILVEEVFRIEKDGLSRKLFGTDQDTHPGVLKLNSLKEFAVGGEVRIDSQLIRDLYTPSFAKKTMNERGWKSIAGFQTRNVPHRAHEYLIRVALEISDGILIQPLVGPTKSGDFSPQAILTSYETLVNNFLPRHRVLLGTLNTSMRFAGPREALFHAVIRRNFGCTHFIVGRDQAGVGGWYGKYDAQDMALEFEDKIGIRILALKGPFFCSACDSIASENTCPQEHLHRGSRIEISGTWLRESIRSGDNLDSRLVRPEIANSVKNLVNLFD